MAYKVLFLGRHGDGIHNAAESYYGTPAWNCYYSELDGNGTVVWADALLTAASSAASWPSTAPPRPRATTPARCRAAS